MSRLALENDIRFTEYRLQSNLSAETRAALEKRLSTLRAELQARYDRKAA